jgi:putative ABC transport system permease protein
MDSLKCQTSTATPAEPGDFPSWLKNEFWLSAVLTVMVSNLKMNSSQLTLAMRDLTRNPRRTLISLSAIAFGVIALLLAGGFIEWIFWAMREATIKTGLGHVQISRTGFRDAGFADPSSYLLRDGSPELAFVRGAPHVEAVGERLLLSGLVSSGETTLAFTGDAVDPVAESTLSNLLPVDGENLDTTDRNGVLLGRGLAKALGVKRGDTLSFIVNLPGGGINAVEGRLRGIFATQVKAYDDSAVRMPIALARSLLRVKGSHLWVIGLSSSERSDETVAYLRERLPVDGFEIKSWFDLSDFYQKSVTLLSRQLELVSLLIGVIIVLGISNTLTMSVLERTGEIGTIMAMGTPPRSVLHLFIFQGFLLGVIGGIIGLTMGFALAQIISYFGIPMPPPPGRDIGYSAEILLTPRLAFWGAVVAVVPATLASLYPAWKASRLPIVDALRHNR